MVSLQTIQEMCTGRIAFNEPLAPMTSFRIGGPADFYIEPVDREELTRLVGYFRSRNFPFIILGNGSNLLISDEGFHGAVLNLERHFSSVDRSADLIRAGAGIRMATFVDFCIEHNLSGVEMLAGIPGTLGGALVMNAGAYGGEISDHLLDVTIIRGGGLMVIPKGEAGFTYRSSGLGEDVLVEATFRFPPGEKEEMKQRRKELLLKRNSTQPTGLPNAGSIFKNPPDAFAAKLIEESGLKGFAVGDAEVSTIHANFIVNRGAATAMDVVAVIRHVYRTVRDRTGILLEPEVRLVGFDPAILEDIPAASRERSGETGT